MTRSTKVQQHRQQQPQPQSTAAEPGRRGTALPGMDLLDLGFDSSLQDVPSGLRSWMALLCI